MSAQLTFYIADGILTGTAGGHLVHIRAVSGGGGGSTRHPGNADMDNPGSQAVQTKDHKTHRGGPIPVGRYRIGTPARHAHLGLSSRLDPWDHDQAQHMYGRSGFYIHGRGPLGSDGCVVPMESFHELMAWLAKDHGGALVVEAGMGGPKPA